MAVGAAAASTATATARTTATTAVGTPPMRSAAIAASALRIVFAMLVFGA